MYGVLVSSYSVVVGSEYGIGISHQLVVGSFS